MRKWRAFQGLFRWFVATVMAWLPIGAFVPGAADSWLYPIGAAIGAGLGVALGVELGRLTPPRPAEPVRVGAMKMGLCGPCRAWFLLGADGLLPWHRTKREALPGDPSCPREATPPDGVTWT